MTFRRPLNHWLPPLYVRAQLVSAIFKQLFSHLETMHVALAVPVPEDGTQQTCRDWHLSSLGPILLLAGWVGVVRVLLLGWRDYFLQ